MAALLYLAFFISGIAGLVYETVWSRYLALIVGHGAYAQVVVLAVFLGGLALGALWVGRRSERIARPLRAYGLVEMGIGLVGLTFHPIFVAVRDLAEGVVYPWIGDGATLTVVRWGIAAAVLIGPSFLLGTTFPLITAGFLRVRPRAPGHALAVFYFLNSFGAALGALFTGFVLIAQVGLPGSTVVAGMLNLGAGALAWAVSSRVEGTSPSPSPHPSRGGESSPAPGATEGPDAPTTNAAPSPAASAGSARDPWRLLLFVAFGTAVASFIYEIAWIRMLSLVLGSATHAFELMLSAFILGLAIGAWVIRGRADALRDPERTLGWIQWSMGAAALLTLPVYLSTFTWTEWLLAVLPATDSGYFAYNAARYGISLAVMLPATILAGTTLPLISMVLLKGTRGERAVGWVYGMNTLGSILGVSVAALVLLPAIGLKALLVTGAALDMLLGVWLLRQVGAIGGDAAEVDAVPGGGVLRRTTPLRLLVGTVALTAFVVWASPFELRVLGSGVFRTGVAAGAEEVVFWKDGRTASVGVLDYRDQRILSTNGKPDASLSFRWLARDTITTRTPLAYDESTQALIALITLAHRPAADRALVIGHGSGMSSHFLLGSPELDEVVTAEIEPEMIEASRAFLPANARVFDDPRSRFALTDARALMAADDRSWDLILSEPSNPWVSGVSMLFTTEFYRQVSERLAPGGVFGQWLHMYEMTDDLLVGVLAAMYPVFEDFRVFRVHAGDVLVVASARGALPRPDWSVMSLPDIQRDLSITFPFEPGYMARTGFLSRAALAPLLAGWTEVNSDFDPRLDLASERARYLGRTAAGLAGASVPGFDPSDAFEVNPYLDVNGPNALPQIPALVAAELGARLQAGAAPNPGERLYREFEEARAREMALDSIVGSGRAPADWVEFVGLVLRIESDRAGGRSGWVEEGLYAYVLEFMATTDAPPTASAVLRFRRAVRARTWSAAEAEIDALVAAAASGPDWVDATFLRDAAVMTRVILGDPAGARRVADALAPRVDRPADDLRSRILEAWISAAERGDLPGAP